MRKIIIVVEGGLIQLVSSNVEDIEIKILDFDDQSEDVCIETEFSPPDETFQFAEDHIEQLKERFG